LGGTTVLLHELSVFFSQHIAPSPVLVSYSRFYGLLEFLLNRSWLEMMCCCFGSHRQVSSGMRVLMYSLPGLPLFPPFSSSPRLS